MALSLRWVLVVSVVLLLAVVDHIVGMVTLPTAVSLAIVPALIAGGAAIVGGMMANRSAKKQQSQMDETQREFAQHGIRWKVADAKAAGVHPLFALGQGGTAPYTPSQVIPNDYGIAEAGSQAASAMNASRNQKQRDDELALLRMQATASAESDFAQASYYRALASKEMQSMAPVSPWPHHIVDQDRWKSTQEDAMQVYNPYSDAIVRRGHLEDQIIPRPLDSYDAWEGVANPRPEDAQPMWSVYDTGRGDIILPFNPADQSLMESLEGLDVKYWPAIIAENRRRYGDAGVKRLLQLYDPFNELDKDKGPAFRDVPGKSPADAFSNMPVW